MRESKISKTLSHKFMNTIILIIMSMLLFNPLFDTEVYLDADTYSSYELSSK